MAIVIDKPGFGAQLGTGLGEGLQMLAQRKLNDLMQAKQLNQASHGLESIGYSPEQAKQLAGLDPVIQREIVKQKLLAPSQEAYAQILGHLSGGGQPGGASTPMEGLNSLTAHQAEKLATLSQQERHFREKQQAAEKKLESQEKISSQKESKEIRSTITNAAKTAKENNQRLDRMEEINNKGELSSGLFYSGLKTFGLDIPALKSADAQEFEKLTYDFLRTARNIFGSRVTNFDVNAMLKMLPTLEQSQEGRKRIINNLKISNQAAIVRDEAMKKIIKDSKGNIPFDLETQIEEMVGPELDKLAEKFKQGISFEEKESKKENKLSVGQKFSELPSPKEFPEGAKIKSPEGKIFVNTGMEWKEENQ